MCLGLHYKTQHNLIQLIMYDFITTVYCYFLQVFD